MKHLTIFVDGLKKAYDEYPIYFEPDKEQPKVPLIQHLLSSVLAGEYYNVEFSQLDEEYYRQIEQLLNRAESLLTSLEDKNSETPLEKNGIFKTFYLHASNSVKEYIGFIEIIRKNQEVFFNYQVDSDRSLYANQSIDVLLLKLESYKQENEEYAYLHLAFSISLHLAELDEKLRCDEATRERLVRYIDMLDIPKTKAIAIQIVRQKAFLLLDKINLRQQICDIKDKLKSPLTKAPSNLGSFKIFAEQARHHYFFITGNLSYEATALAYEENSLSDLHHWNRGVRKFSKSEKDEIKINDLIERLDERMNLLKDQLAEKNTYFQRFAITSAYNLLYNTNIWLQLRKEEINNYKSIIEDLKQNNSISFLKKILNDIQKTQDQYLVYDYHPYESVLKFIKQFIHSTHKNVLEILDKDFKTIKESEEEAITLEIKKKLSKINEVTHIAYPHFKINLRWCDRRSYNAIYLMPEECQVQTQADSKYFLDSAYILPDNYERIRQRWSNNEAIFENEIKILEEFANVELHRIVTDNSVNSKKEEFEKRVKDNEFKLVQIVAMFVSIAAFVLSSVKIYENKTHLESIAIMMGFAACLVMFNAFFRWIINSTFSSRSNFSLIDLLLVISVGLLAWGSWQFSSAQNDLYIKVYNRLEDHSDTLKKIIKMHPNLMLIPDSTKINALRKTQPK